MLVHVLLKTNFAATIHACENGNDFSSSSPGSAIPYMVKQKLQHFTRPGSLTSIHSRDIHWLSNNTSNHPQEGKGLLQVKVFISHMEKMNILYNTAL